MLWGSEVGTYLNDSFLFNDFFLQGHTPVQAPTPNMEVSVD